MTELGERFLAALADQGYGIVFDENDLIILSADMVRRHHVPVVILEEPELELLLKMAILGFSDWDGRFYLGWLTEGEGGHKPGRN